MQILVHKTEAFQLLEQCPKPNIYIHNSIIGTLCSQLKHMISHTLIQLLSIIWSLSN